MKQTSHQIENQILGYLSARKGEVVSFLRRLVLAESPTSDPESQGQILSILAEEFRDLEFVVELQPGRRTGGHLVAEGSGRPDTGGQLLLGHCDTVWPVGTLERMPFIDNGDIVKGPGVFDMKGGLTQMVYALKAIRSLGFWPELRPIAFINSDEEIGSVESEPAILQLVGKVERVFVLEPALGQSGKLKTARKGVGKFTVLVKGRAAHAGLDPGKGTSAILELAYLIQKLYALNDPMSGVSINVGTIEGGLRPNVIAPESRAEVDARVRSKDDIERLEEAILNLHSETPGITLEISGKIGRPPMEPTEDNQRLWRLARSLGERMGIHLEQGMAGGGSDGNTTSQHVATLDGLGAVGDGAHAVHEFIYVDKMIERSALLASLLLLPSQSGK